MWSGVSRALEEFCISYSSSVAKRPEIKKELVELGMPVGLLGRCERARLGALDFRLVSASGRPYVMLRDCVLSDQKQALEKGVEVWDQTAGDSRLIPIDQLSTKQVSQVFAEGRIRTIAEQRTWHSEQSVPAANETQLPYFTRRGELVVTTPCRFIKRQLAQLVKTL